MAGEFFLSFGFTVIDSTALAPGKYDSYFPANPKDALVAHNALVVFLLELLI